jgi:uncharacterized protein YcbK (DUF882 family)
LRGRYAHHERERLISNHELPFSAFGVLTPGGAVTEGLGQMNPGSPEGLLGRRDLLRAGALSLLAAAIGPGIARAVPKGPRRLRMVHTHTGEHLDAVYFDDALLPDALAEVNRFLRDFRTGEIRAIDPGVLDTAWSLAAAAERPGAVLEIVCGYRSPRTNAMLREHSSGVAQRSLHLDGRALDFRLPGVPTRQLRELAISLRRGGVGYYAASDFVHVDTGRFRTW